MMSRMKIISVISVTFLLTFVSCMFIWDIRYEMLIEKALSAVPKLSRETESPTQPSTEPKTTLAPDINDPFLCLKSTDLTQITVPKVQNATIIPGKNIFFLETSCRSQKAGRISLRGRQACAVESAAKAHPNMNIILIVLAPVPMGQPPNPYIEAILNNYKNVRILHANVTQYFQNTPVEKLYLKGSLKMSSWPMVHLSDVLRYVTLWKYGGIYLDLDVLVIKNLEDIVPNFTGVELPGTIAAGVLGFDYTGDGHKWVEAVLTDINKTYNPNHWSYNALGVLQKQLSIICGTTNVKEWTNRHCHGYKVFDTNAFYAVPYSIWPDMFKNKTVENVLKRLSHPDARLMHAWNKLSSGMKPENGSAYKLLATKYCPHVDAVINGDF